MTPLPFMNVPKTSEDLSLQQDELKGLKIK